MELGSELGMAVVKVAIAGGIAGVVGAFIGSRRASLFGSFLMGALGGLATSAIVNVAGFDLLSGNPLFEAGAGFSYAWAAIGGVFLGYVVTKSSSPSSVRGSKWGRSR